MIVEINANRIGNETLKKLNRLEIASLGLLNGGIYTYIGTPKCRVKGFKTTKNTLDEIWYESEEIRYEVIKIQAVCDGDNNHYAVRRIAKDSNTYEEFWPVLWGCNFFK